MFHYGTTLQSAFKKTATVFDFACTVLDRLYWLDDHYVQPFYTWAAPRLRDVAISGIYWALVTLIDVTLWLIDTTLQFMARDAHAIALNAFAKAHEPLLDYLALPPAAVPLALPSMALPIAPSPDLVLGDDLVPAIDSTLGTSRKNALMATPQLLANAIRLGLNLFATDAEMFQRIDDEFTPGSLLMLPPSNYKNAKTIAPAKAEDDLTYSLLVPGALGTRKSRKKNAVTR